MPRIIDSAIADIRGGYEKRRLWLALASEDIGEQHRRTTLGPFWLVINYLAFAGTFIFVFYQDGALAPGYPAYVATGLLVWLFIMETINQAVSLFVREESFIKGTRLPLSVYVMRLATQSAIRSAYALVGCLAILFLAGTAPSAAWLWSLIAVALILATAPAAIALFAFLGAFFPDSQFIVANLTRIGMFLTPVFWTYDDATGIRAVFSHWNPFTYFLEIVRMPITSGEVPLFALAVCATICACLWAAALFALGGLRRQVVFVL